ncbi:hypothetical protein ACFQZ2_20540, partial [Streptomonospora algeriensis]
MTDDTGPRTPDSGADQTWAHPHGPEEGRPEVVPHSPDPASAEQQAAPATPQQHGDPSAWRSSRRARR